ncbi:MAG: hypothetical protein IKE65_06500 [Clostridia bacterium]|nr:hypothetical protein [Clostridia bacterium]
MKKIIAIVLAAVMLFSLTGCSLLLKTETVECTCPGCLAAKNGQDQESSVEYSKLQASSKSGVDCSNLPTDKEAILQLYTDVANATKAAKEQTVDVIAEGAKIQVGAIIVDETGKELAPSLMPTANKLIDSFSPKPEEYTCAFSNGEDKNGNKTTTTDDIRTPKNTLPAWEQDYMCELSDDMVKEATAEKLSDGYWKVTIILNDAQCEMTDPNVTPDTPHAHCMGTVQSKDLLTDFGGNGTIYYADLTYKDSAIVAVIDPESGYLVQLHTSLFIYGDAKMDVKLMSIGNVTASLEKTTFINTYNWTAIG